MDDKKQTALDNAITEIEKNYGKGAIQRLGQSNGMDIKTISTGSLSIDIALGVGGIPQGRIIEIYGPESSGKTTVALHIIAEIQRHGGVAAFIDAEHALDPAYAKNIGVDINYLYVSQPDDGEQALEITEVMVRSGSVDLIVIDSVAALVPKAEINGEMGDSHVGLQARLMSQALRKLTAYISNNHCTVIFINQLREKIGSYSMGEVTTGGRALKFYASVRMDVRKVDTIKRNNCVIGNHVKVKIVKNKVAPPFSTAEMDLFYRKGICHTGEVLDFAEVQNIIRKSGSWYYYQDSVIVQGREDAILYFEGNHELMELLESQIRQNIGISFQPAS